MKTKRLLISWIVLMVLSLQFHLQAQNENSLTLHIEPAGKLKSLVGDKVEEVTSLTLTGKLNGSDIEIIREMKNLSFLDIGEVNIVKGGHYYYTTYDRLGKEVNHYTDNDIIGDYMFMGLFKLNEIIIPENIIEIGNSAFESTAITSFEISDNIVEVGNGAFGFCTQLTHLKIGKNITEIKSGTFNSCTRLSSVEIPDNITHIRYGAFQACTGLSNIAFGKNIVEIDDLAFHNCKSLTTLDIPSSVVKIGSSTFYNCAGLTSINIGENVTEIGVGAFGHCTSLTQIEIPDNVVTIGYGAFQYCTGLTDVNMGENVQEIGMDAFGFCPNLTTIDIPDNVSIIKTRAFEYCSSLSSVNIGENVTDIETQVFMRCDKLENVYSERPSPPTAASYSFPSSLDNCTLYIPKGSIDAYKVAPEWNRFTKMVEKDFTSMDDIETDGITVIPILNGIRITTGESVPVSIFTSIGQKVYESQINGDTNIILNKGIYIVKIKEEAQKILIK